MNLHLVFSSPLSSPALKECLSLYQTGDGIVLLEDGVYTLLSQSHLEELKLQLTSNVLNAPNFYAITDDLTARGISDTPPFENITYDDLVTLTLKYKKTISWR
jgi:sulfur relay protein TusB/DsrH